MQESMRGRQKYFLYDRNLLFHVVMHNRVLLGFHIIVAQV